jgi:SHS2 domain-containing protein
VPFEYLEDGVTADITLRARGRTLDELFAAAADATVNVMVASLDSIHPIVSKKLLVSAEALDLLLMHVLEEIIFHKDAEALVLRLDTVHVECLAAGYRVEGELRGEVIDPTRHELVADVKGVTLHNLSVEHEGEEWRAEVTLDV